MTCLPARDPSWEGRAVGAQRRGCESRQCYEMITEERRPHLHARKIRSCVAYTREPGLATNASSGEPLAEARCHCATDPRDSCGGIHPTLCLSFHADAAEATSGRPDGILPFEVHHAFRDSRGGIEGRQEFLPQLDGLYSEHLQGRVKGHCESWRINLPRLLGPEWEVR